MGQNTINTLEVLSMFYTLSDYMASRISTDAHAMMNVALHQILDDRGLGDEYADFVSWMKNSVGAKSAGSC